MKTAEERLNEFIKEHAIEFLLANLDSEPITDKDIRIFYEGVYDEWIESKE